MRLLLLVLSMFTGMALIAQNTATLKGKLVDSVGKQALKDASITILEAKDSTLDVFGLAKADGSFVVEKISFGEMIVMIKFQGYEAYSKKINFSKANASVDLGTIYLRLAANDLGEVTVTQSPITIKKDTVQFNASSFKTKPNAVMEDLLKKLPGVQVEADGTVKAQGENVQRILVDGKRFFGDDPKLATKNLPPDMIDKIQVFDALNDQSAFTGFDDGNRIKTINITTKKDKRKGYFGRVIAGGGSDSEEGRYDNSVNLSYFNGDRQLTFTGQANNVNKQNFGAQDLFGGGGGGGRTIVVAGGGGRGGAGGATNNSGGIIRTLAAGLNYKDIWGKKTEVSGSYFFNDMQTTREQNSYTQNLIPGNPDSSIFNSQLNNSITKNKNHRINFNIEHQFDSSNSLIIRPNISFQETESATDVTTFSTRGTSKNLNNSIASTDRSNSGFNASLEATFRHRFKKKGRTYSIAFNPGKSVNDGNTTNYSINNFFNTTTPYADTINQIGVTNRDSKTMNATFSYTEPIGKNQIIEFNYNYNSNVNNSGTKTFAFNKANGQYDIVVPNLTNVFENTFNSNRVTLNYRLQNAKYNFSIGSGVQVGDLISKNLSKDSSITQNFVNFFPTMNFRYDFSRTKNLRIFYNGRTGQPTAQQLQPVVDNSNPLNITTGNPNLKQQFIHTFRILFSSFDVVTQKIFFATINANFTANDIQNSTTYLPNGAQFTRPVNLSGTYNVNGFLNYGFPLKKPKSNLNFGLNLSRNQSQTLVNDLSNYTRNTTAGFNASWTTNIKEGFDMNFSSNSSLSFARYTLQPQQNGDFFTQTFVAEPTVYTKSGWVFSTDFRYIKNTGRAEGFNTNIPLWSASIAKQLFKKKDGELKFYVFDLLNQNQSLTRNVTGNTIQDVSTVVLKRYFMISFTYNLRSFGAPQGGMQQRGQNQIFRGAPGQGMQMMRNFRQ
ncbi:outer membrane beta-barrel protein [Sediminibacterium sp.]|uniref:outer membrane beta-barrel protein n=1 Tax=Sediminibacterium sp. TaxID=1917865 RepID=UPI0027327B40|nr:outer membrane beta-barrel protein [Sediminibacterium sp.]MDP3393435.1 outer membrane beta-barrel protein [Sediminibacterium sp.]MDP3568037.1 outer membrane beta-barrel protein [Sediminibacterium sp.]